MEEKLIRKKEVNIDKTKIDFFFFLRKKEKKNLNYDRKEI